MKNYEVVIEFIDKNTNEYYKKGSFYPAPNVKRAKELISKGYLKDEGISAGDDDESGQDE